MPTILEWLGLPVPRQCDGRSLLPFCDGQPLADWRTEVHYEFDFRDLFYTQPESDLGLPMDKCSLAVVQDDSFKYVHFAALPPLSPMDRLKRMVNGTLTYLATHENISRISILTDLNTPGQGDNTQQTVQVFLPLVAEVLKPAGREAEAKAKTYQMIMAFQGLFLRAHLLNEELGLSLFDSLQREAFIDAFIDDFFAGCTPPEL